MNPGHVIAAMLGVAAGSLLALITTLTTPPKADKLTDFCKSTRWAIHEDRVAFESGTDEDRESALARFYESRTIYHNHESMLLCLDEIPPYPITCSLNKDFRCLAVVSADLEQQLRNLE